MSNERLLTALNWVKEHLKISDLLESYGAWDSSSVVDRYNYQMISCPLHLDETPSFRIMNSQTWNCFSCGKGGDYVTLLRVLFEGRFGSSLNIYRALDMILSENAQMVASLGFSTVSEEIQVNVGSDWVSKRSKVKLGAVSEGVPELVAGMKSRGLTAFEDIAFAQAMLYGSDRSPETILNLFNKPSVVMPDAASILDFAND